VKSKCVSDIWKGQWAELFAEAILWGRFCSQSCSNIIQNYFQDYGNIRFTCNRKNYTLNHWQFWWYKIDSNSGRCTFTSLTSNMKYWRVREIRIFSCQHGKCEKMISSIICDQCNCNQRNWLSGFLNKSELNWLSDSWWLNCSGDRPFIIYQHKFW